MSFLTSSSLGHLIPIVSLIALVMGAIYRVLPLQPNRLPWVCWGLVIEPKVEGSFTGTFVKEGLLAACRLYCMIGLILAGAAFLTLAMGFIGLPREVAQFIGGSTSRPSC
jgi:C4-dicarboxylate transporter, DctM subunit